MNWAPGCKHHALVARAHLYETIRSFFKDRGVLEVETPLLSRYFGTEPSIQPLLTRYEGAGFAGPVKLYLQSSPEFAMKRLLVAGSGSIYQICKSFRNGELGRQHQPEFSMLEWYRVGFDLKALMSELDTLLRMVIAHPVSTDYCDYGQLFMRATGVDPYASPDQTIRDALYEAGLEQALVQGLDRQALLERLFDRVILPEFDSHVLYLISGYPAEQAALAAIDQNDARVALRFEVYFNGLELANGFQELQDETEQRARFKAENRRRQTAGLAEMPLDERLLEALNEGLPVCSGVAVGLDRLLMATLGVDDISKVLTFPLEPD